MTDAPPPTENTPLCVEDFARLARRTLPAHVWDFIDGASGDESTPQANRRSLDRIRLVPRVLTGVAEPDTRAQLAGTDSSAPLAVAPMAYQRLMHNDGEIGAAKAAREAGVPFIASTLSSYPIEEIAAAGARTWFQLYWLKDRARVADLITRSENAGCTAIQVTVDVPIMGKRVRDERNGFALPSSINAANLTGDPDTGHRRNPWVSAVARHTAEILQPSLTWDDLEWLRGRTTLPLVIKGVLDPRDAVAAAQIGADAVVVSNHGGRQLAAAVPSIEVLPAVAEAVGDRCQVLLDSGIRSGTDILRALSLGACGVLIARPVLWGLAVDGTAGAAQVLRLLRTELSTEMILAGCADLAAARALSTIETAV